MNTPERRQSTMPPDPPSQPVLSRALALIAALSFTIVLIQVQAANQGSARDLLPVLAAALLAIAGRSAPDQPEP